MGDLREMIKQHSVKNCDKLKRICAPLFDCLKIPIFDFYRIEESGRFGSLTNSPDFLDYYYATKQYLINPYLSHPRLFCSGYTISPVSFQSEYSDTMHKLFGISYLFIMLQQKGDCVEAFIFGNRDLDPHHTISLISHVDLLHKFGAYFKREASRIIKGMMEDNFNLEKAKGESFFTSDTSLPLFNKNPTSRKFLKGVAPLSYQEIRCLELYKLGHSSQESAAILKLSQRTVESYFDNIKNKLGCRSKTELLDW